MGGSWSGGLSLRGIRRQSRTVASRAWRAMSREYPEAISEFPGKGAREMIGAEPGAKSSFSNREVGPPGRDQESERLMCNPAPEY